MSFTIHWTQRCKIIRYITFSQWKDLGYEISEVPEIEPATHSVKINPEIMHCEYLEKVKENKNVVIIGNRERLNYLEQHIPDAINILTEHLQQMEKF